MSIDLSVKIQIHKKLSKLQDHLDEVATEWLETYIKEVYGVNDSVELTKEQISEIDKANRPMKNYDPKYVLRCFVVTFILQITLCCI